MSDEQTLINALSSPDFQVSIHDKKRTDALEKETVVENKEKFGEDSNPQLASSTDQKRPGNKSLLATFQSMSAEQRQKVIENLQQNGLGKPLTKEKLVQNAFTVEQAIQENSSK